MRIRIVASYVLACCGGYTSEDLLEKGIIEKKPWKVILGGIILPLSLIGASFAIRDSRLALLEKKNEEKED